MATDRPLDNAQREAFALEIQFQEEKQRILGLALELHSQIENIIQGTALATASQTGTGIGSLLDEIQAFEDKIKTCKPGLDRQILTGMLDQLRNARQMLLADIEKLHQKM